MVQMNRIDYQGYNRHFILEKITQVLDDQNKIEEILEESETPVVFKFYTSEDALQEIKNAGNPFVGVIAQIAFKNKNQIKRLPILGQYAIKIKESYLSRECRMKDVSHLLSLDVNQFIYGCYKELLKREPDSRGFATYQKMICEGAPKEAIIYLITVSAEFAGHFKIDKLESYKKAYKAYQWKRRIKGVPLLGYLMSFILLPKLIKSIIIEYKINSANQRQQIEVTNEILTKILKSAEDLSKQFHDKFIRTEQLIGNLEKEILIQNSLKSQVEILENMILLQNKRFDDKFSGEKLQKEFISKGILNIPSYLESAKEQSNEEAIKQFSRQDKFYYYLENLFRGNEETIRERQSFYLEYVKQAYKNTDRLPFADIGCGRGEFLEVLESKGIKTIGIEVNRAVASIPIERGYNVVIQDGKQFLENTGDESLSGISMFQVAEHLEFEYLFDLCSTASKKIKKGGCILIETINPFCYKRIGNFNLDPSHIFMPSPEPLKLMLEMLNFQDVLIRFSAPIKEEALKNEGIINLYENYCLIARRG